MRTPIKFEKLNEDTHQIRMPFGVKYGKSDAKIMDVLNFYPQFLPCKNHGCPQFLPEAKIMGVLNFYRQ